MNWFRKPKIIRRIRPSGHVLRLEDWQRSPALISEMAKFLSLPIGRAMLDTLREESPSSYGLPELGVTVDDRAAYQSRIEGYHLCLNNLEAMATASKEKPQLEATFEPPEIEI